MCGISGFLPFGKDVTKEQILEIVKLMLDANQHRGRDATGIASYDIDNCHVHICKQAEEASVFIKNLKPDHILGPTIGHNRAKTQGDQSDPNNNHPMFGEKYCLVHNGVVSTMKELPNYKLKGKCDTEVLLSYIETFGIKAAIPRISGSAAFALFDPTNKKMYLYKHTSPVYIAYIPGKGIAFSSTDTCLKKIPDMLKTEKVWGLFSPLTITELEEGQLVTIDIATHEITVETIKVEYQPGIYNFT